MKMGLVFLKNSDKNMKPPSPSWCYSKYFKIGSSVTGIQTW